jgi:hypothetical protein
LLKIVYDVEDTDISVYDILKERNILEKKVWRYNGQTKRERRRTNDIQNTIEKTKDRATRIPLTHGVNLGVPEG